MPPDLDTCLVPVEYHDRASLRWLAGALGDVNNVVRWMGCLATEPPATVQVSIGAGSTSDHQITRDLRGCSRASSGPHPSYSES